MAAPGIAILLPHAEHFGPDGAGAIALHVRDATGASRFRHRIRVHGRAVAHPFAGLPFEPLKPAWGAVLGRNLGLAEALHRRLRQRGPVLVELHNRPQVFHHLAWRNPGLALTIRFANDPQTMRHARSVRARARILGHARAVYCVSDYVRGRFLEGLPGDPGKVHVVITGIGRTLGRPPGKEALIVYAGRISDDKGVGDLVEALVRVLPEHPRWRAEIIGASGPDPASRRWQSRLRERTCPAGEQIAWRGYLDNDAVLARLRCAAVVVIPSRWPEPLARTAVEALAAGAAVVAYPTGGLPEALRGRGLLVDPPAPAGLAEALARVVGDDALRRRLQQQAWCDYPFTLSAMVQRLDQIRATILAEIARRS